MLTPDQQDALDYYLRRINRLTNERFILEMTDHYIDAISERMAQGMTFETALTDIQKAFGGCKRLQKMEREYNRVTYRQYDALWLEQIRIQSRWPHVLFPLFVFLVTYWITTHTDRPVSFSMDVLTNNPWRGFLIGSILGFIIRFFYLAAKDGIRGKNLSYKAVYLVTRFLPITVTLYGSCALLTYINSYLPPFVYEFVLACCAAMIVAYMMAYSRFNQVVFKDVARGN